MKTSLRTAASRLTGTGDTFVLFAAIVLAGCAALPGEPTGEAESAIKGGAPDVRDEGVVGVVRRSPGSNVVHICSGTLIAPNLVLTARHCIADTGDFVACPTSAFGTPVPPEQIGVTNGASIWAGDAAWTNVVELTTPPGGDAVCGQDVALLILGAPFDASTLPLTPRLDRAAQAGEPYTAIGYGRSGGQANDVGLRRRRDSLEILCVGGACGSRQVEDGEFRGDHGVCNGDSGGPAVDKSGLVIGVTSRDVGGCELPVYGRIDAHADWIRATAWHAAQRGGYPAPAWAAPGTWRATSSWELKCSVIQVGAGDTPVPWGIVTATLGLAALAGRARGRASAKRRWAHAAANTA